MTTILPIGRQSSLVDQAFDQLVEAISRGDFEPGQSVKEAQLAKQLGISRGPLREAMNRLEARNLVERRPRFGVQVVRLTQTDLAELFTMREALEGMACRLAATAMSEQELAALVALLEAHGRSKGVRTGSDYYQGSADEDFHIRIVRGSGNTRLIKALCEDLYYQVRIYRYRSSVTPGRAHAAYSEHKAIVKALLARDPDRAEAAMRKHISNAQVNLILGDTTTVKKERVHA